MRQLLGRVRQTADAGVTLVEVIVTMLLLGIVSTIVTTAVIQANQIVLHTRDETTGLTDVRNVVERLGRDVRDARGVVCDGGLADPSDSTSADPSCNSHLQLWIDYDADYVSDEDEIVTWRLQAEPDGEHFAVLRVRGNGLNGNVPVTQRSASTLVMRFAFTYDAAPPASQVVRVGMRYDAEVGVGTDERQIAFSTRLRNKGTK